MQADFERERNGGGFSLSFPASANRLTPRLPATSWREPMATDAATAKQRTFLGHPIGLYVLFFTEMWERFSYYGMRALLMLYMVNFFRMSQKDASAIYKWYTSLVYLTPLLGGYLADRYLGNKRAVIIGALLMAIGH